MAVRAVEFPEWVGPQIEGIPWDDAEQIYGVNWIPGLVKGSFHWFPKYDVCMFMTSGFDGSVRTKDTALHDGRNMPLSSSHVPYAVLPLKEDDEEVEDLTDYGVGLGDLGIVYRKMPHTVLQAPFVFGDSGQQRPIGEGSVKLSKDLCANGSATEDTFVWIVFCGTTTCRSKPRLLLRTEEEIVEDAWHYFDLFAGGLAKEPRKERSS